MDLSEIFEGAYVKALRAEALHIIHKAMRRGSDEYTNDFGFVSDVARVEYNEGKRLATRVLFDGYAKAALDRRPEAKVFVAFLPKISEQVDRDLQRTYDGVRSEYRDKQISRIDFHEAESCRLEWEQEAWRQEKPTLIKELGQIVSAFFGRRMDDAPPVDYNQRTDQATGARAHSEQPIDDMSVDSGIAMAVTATESPAELNRNEVLDRLIAIGGGRGLNKNKLAQAVAKEAGNDKTAVLRVLNGGTEKPGASIQNAIFDVLKIDRETERSMRTVLGWNLRE